MKIKKSDFEHFVCWIEGRALLRTRLFTESVHPLTSLQPSKKELKEAKKVNEKNILNLMEEK